MGLGAWGVVDGGKNGECVFLKHPIFQAWIFMVAFGVCFAVLTLCFNDASTRPFRIYSDEHHVSIIV